MDDRGHNLLGLAKFCELVLGYHEVALGLGVLRFKSLDGAFSSGECEWSSEEANGVGYVIAIAKSLVKVSEVILRLMKPML